MKRRHRQPRATAPHEDIATDAAGFADLDGGAARRTRRLPPADVLHQDEHFIAVNKAPGAWAEQAPDGGPSVFEHLAALGLIEEDCDAQPVYPIEPPLSGVALYARTPESLEAADRLIAADALHLTCLAIVAGHAASEADVIRGPVPPRLRAGEALRYIDTCPGEPATHWKLLDALVAFAVVECRPYPALPSLVRAHLASVGMPLAVDPAFGGARSLMLSSFKAGYHPSRRHAERPLMARISLHVQRLTFAHPFGGQAVELTAPPPKDMRAALHQLDRFGRIAPGAPPQQP